MKALLHLTSLFLSLTPASSFAPIYRGVQRAAAASSVTALQGKKSKRKGKQAQAPREKKSVQDARFDAMTQNFMFTMVGLSKLLPDKSKTILKDIHLSFYPGAKIGVVGLNGSG